MTAYIYTIKRYRVDMGTIDEVKRLHAKEQQ